MDMRWTMDDWSCMLWLRERIGGSEGDVLALALGGINI
jgi:hypothetical protein